MAKIDWTAAKADYIADIKLSYADVARKYGVSLTVVAERAGKEEWQKLRRMAYVKAEQKLITKTANTLAEHQERLMRQAQFVAGRGLQGIARHAPRSARESKELWEAGAGMQAKVLGFDKPNVQVNNNTQNNFFTIDGFVAEMEKRRKLKDGGQI